MVFSFKWYKLYKLYKSTACLRRITRRRSAWPAWPCSGWRGALHVGQRGEAFGGGFQRALEGGGMDFRLFDLLVEFGDGGAVAFLDGQMAELRVHFGVLVDFALDGDFQRLGRRHLRFRV